MPITLWTCGGVIPILPVLMTVLLVFQAHQSRWVVSDHSDWSAFAIQRDVVKDSPRLVEKDFAVRAVRGVIAVLLVISCVVQTMWPCCCGLACRACRADHCVHDAKCHTCSHSHQTTSIRDQATAIDEATLSEPPVAPKNRCIFCTGQFHWLAERESKWSLSDDLSKLMSGPSGSRTWLAVRQPAVVHRLTPISQHRVPECALKSSPRMQV
jgi:hypothetical protein